MKVKLLKKIRKRYQIIKIIKISSRLNYTDSWYKECEKEFGLPFFVLEDNQDGYGIRTRAYRNYDAALLDLIKWIKKDYTHKVKKDKTIEEKVWYGQKQHK